VVQSNTGRSTILSLYHMGTVLSFASWHGPALSENSLIRFSEPPKMIVTVVILQDYLHE
jgi:hypothetical protein